MKIQEVIAEHDLLESGSVEGLSHFCKSDCKSGHSFGGMSDDIISKHDIENIRGRFSVISELDNLLVRKSDYMIMYI